MNSIFWLEIGECISWSNSAWQCFTGTGILCHSSSWNTSIILKILTAIPAPVTFFPSWQHINQAKQWRVLARPCLLLPKYASGPENAMVKIHLASKRDKESSRHTCHCFFSFFLPTGLSLIGKNALVEVNVVKFNPLIQTQWGTEVSRCEPSGCSIVAFGANREKQQQVQTKGENRKST